MKDYGVGGALTTEVDCDVPLGGEVYSVVLVDIWFQVDVVMGGHQVGRKAGYEGGG